MDQSDGSSTHAVVLDATIFAFTAVKRKLLDEIKKYAMIDFFFARNVVLVLCILVFSTMIAACLIMKMVRILVFVETRM